MKQEILSRLPEVPAGRPPILFVHGAYCAAGIWAEYFMGYFAAQGYPSYAVSLRGHGGSDGDLAQATFNDYVSDVGAAAGTIGGEPIIIGHSMGGLAAQHYVANGGRAKALVALSSAPPSGLRSSALHMTMFAPDVLFQLAMLQSLGPDMASPAVISRALVSRRSGVDAKEIMKLLQRESPLASADLFAPPAMPRPNEESPPIYVVGGDADVFLPRTAFQETADFWKAELELLEGAPHALMIDNVWRDVAAGKILAWLRRRLER
ncbi:alpha/beta hydrolase fold protein [Methylocella silvestris BL2]|uniref:Alpha/beta hydrolase fold protein n=1 Tax=Methylocella silvestris (strain DSM 15510 / CIP 108128 / LMG 27833 / NCIMB 13906 / BL2) TaxID=395965 RepID=B8EPC3_METSB|nr:alpha/beta hydrolase [Methylocella silvestris]ACK49711.1 alpha/beta hydrolase fold protein [Methylocella silvestris BL2]